MKIDAREGSLYFNCCCHSLSLSLHTPYSKMWWGTGGREPGRIGGGRGTGGGRGKDGKREF